MATTISPSSSYEEAVASSKGEVADIVHVNDVYPNVLSPYSRIYNGPTDKEAAGDKEEKNHGVAANNLSFNARYCCSSYKRSPTTAQDDDNHHFNQNVAKPTIIVESNASLCSSASCSINVGDVQVMIKPAAAAAAAAAPLASFALAVTPADASREINLKRRVFAVEGGRDVSSSKHAVANSTFAQATFNCTSLLLGLGILSSPYAMAQAGWFGGAISLTVASTYAYATLLLMRCQERTGCGTYQELAKIAVGRKARLLIEALFYMEIFGSLLGYCISVADNLEHTFPSSHFALPGLNCRNAMLLLACTCVLPTVWLRDLSVLSFTSVWTIVSTAVLLIAVLLAATVVDHIGFQHSIPLVSIRGAPVAAGLYAYAYGGTSVFPSVYTSMKDPSKFTQVLLLSFAITTTLMCGLGVAGAYMFGWETASQITLSMPANRITTKIVLWMTVLTPLFKFALVLSPISTAMDIKLNDCFRDYSPRAQLAITTLMRSGVLALIVIAAMALPYFNYVVALIGSSMSIAICLVFPCIFYVKLCRDRITRPSIALILFMGAFAVVAAVCGTIVSFQGLVDSKKSHTS